MLKQYTLLLKAEHSYYGWNSIGIIIKCDQNKIRFNSYKLNTLIGSSIQNTLINDFIAFDAIDMRLLEKKVTGCETTENTRVFLLKAYHELNSIKKSHKLDRFVLMLKDIEE